MRMILEKVGLCVPLAMYLWCAQRVALFVPCITDIPSNLFDHFYIRKVAHTMWLLDVKGERIRYDLIAYKEFLLFAALVLVYGIILSCSPTLRYKVRWHIADLSKP